MHSGAVSDLQALLTSLGYGAQPDGIFGPETERAVKAFQRAQGLADDGIVGPATYAALDATVRQRPSLLAFLRRLWRSVLALVRKA
jgi:peptidoglycan hydrolase-like protein with peptidoglycan-binding domain